MLATTLSLVAIFAPVGFMSGMVGRFMQSFGLTMAFAVMVSLFVSFTLTPMMSAHWLAEAAPRTGRDHDSKHSAVRSARSRLHAMLEWAMAHRGLVAVGAVLVLLSSVPLFRIVNVNFTPQDDQSEFDVSVRAPEARAWRGDRGAGQPGGDGDPQLPEVDYTLVTVAGDAAGTLNTASVFVRLKPIDERASAISSP